MVERKKGLPVIIHSRRYGDSGLDIFRINGKWIGIEYSTAIDRLRQIEDSFKK